MILKVNDAVRVVALCGGNLHLIASDWKYHVLVPFWPLAAERQHQTNKPAAFFIEIGNKSAGITVWLYS